MPLARETGRRADAGQAHVLDELAAQREELDLGRGVLEIQGDEAVADEAHVGQRVFRLGDDFLPVLLLRRAEVDGDHAAARGASTSVLKNSRGPSLPRKVNSCSKLSISSKGMA